jgi:hypothetical protein
MRGWSQCNCRKQRADETTSENRGETNTAQQSNDTVGNFVQYRADGNTKVKNFVVTLDFKKKANNDVRGECF